MRFSIWTGRSSTILLKNPRYLNAEDDTTIANVETAVDLACARAPGGSTIARSRSGRQARPGAHCRDAAHHGARAGSTSPSTKTSRCRRELLATPQADKALGVQLIGHTDAQGSAAYNLDLSQRRAAAVYLWLIQQGMDSGRLRFDGRGLIEPIADNATDQGGALNRACGGEGRQLNG
jgi:hypothetical protein